MNVDNLYTVFDLDKNFRNEVFSAGKPRIENLSHTVEILFLIEKND